MEQRHELISHGCLVDHFVEEFIKRFIVLNCSFFVVAISHATGQLHLTALFGVICVSALTGCIRVVHEWFISVRGCSLE